MEDEGDNFIWSRPLSAHEEDLMNADVFGIRAFGRESKHAEDTARNVTYCLIETIQKAQKKQINSQESTFSTVWIHWLLSHFPREALSPLPKEVMKNYKWSLTSLYLASLYLIYLGIGMFIDCPLQSGMQRMESQAEDEVRYVKYVRYANCLCKNTIKKTIGWSSRTTVLPQE